MEVTVREMTNEAIEKIKAAEAEAVAIRSDADAKAEKMKAEAKELRRTAQFRMHAASEEIIRGIYRQCQ